MTPRARANAIAHDDISVWYYGGEIYPTALADLIEAAITEAMAEERERADRECAETWATL